MKFAFTLLSIGLLFLCARELQCIRIGDVEVRLDDLQAQVQELKEEVTELSHLVDNRDLEKMVKHNIADQKLDKAVASLLMNKQHDADMYWKEVTDLIAPSMHNSYLKTLVENTYLGNCDNFYFVLDFITRNVLYAAGYPMLYKELEMHRELYTGQEIFALAHQVRSLCGTKSAFYKNMPEVIKLVLSGPVILQNIENEGYVIADEDYKLCTTKRDCYEYAETQVHIYRPAHMTLEELQNEPRAHWQFVGPENNITALSLGFYIKNQHRDLYFVFRQRPGGTFLRDSLDFHPYYSRDFHGQFEPALVPTSQRDDLVLLIGVRERFFRKIEYFKSADFVKRQAKADFSRLPIFQGNVTGYVWEAIPVNGSDGIDNDIDSNADDKCNFIL